MIHLVITTKNQLKMNNKRIVSIGLKDISKADLEVKKISTKGETHHIIGHPNYEISKSKLATRLLQFGLQEIEIPFAGPKNSLFESLISRRYASPEKVAETLRDLISQLTRLYHVSVTERNQYIDVAIDKLNKEYSLSADDTKKLRDDITFILNDGISKTFRDNIGRQVPIPEATAMAGMVTTMTNKMKDVLSSGASLIDVEGLAALLRQYIIIERRAELSASEFDKRQIFDELTGMTTKIANDPLLCMLIKNRMEYTTNASSQTVRMSSSKFAELINTPILSIEAVSVDTSVKILEFASPIIDSVSALDDIDFVSLGGVIAYIEDVCGAVSMQRTTSDIVNILFQTGEGDTPTPSTGEKDKYSMEVVREVHMMFFKLELIKMIAQSFTTIPPYNSVGLAQVTQSFSAKLDVYTVEPFVIALDNVKHAYVSSFKEALEVFKTGLIVPTDSELVTFRKKMESPPVYKFLLTGNTSDNAHDALYTKGINDMITAYESRKVSVATLSGITESSWKIGRVITEEAKGTHLVARSILYNVESHVETSVDVITDDGTMTDEEMIAIMTGTSGKFKTCPYQVFKYSFGAADVDMLFSHTTLPNYETLRESGIARGISDETAGSVVMLDSESSVVNKLIQTRLGQKTSKFWVVKLPMYAVFIPKIKYKMRYFDPFSDSAKSSIVNSPLLQVGVTSVKAQEVDRIVCSFVKDNTVMSVLANTWPSISTRVTPISDLTKHKYLSALLPSDTTAMLLQRNINTGGVPVLEPVKNKEVVNTPLLDIQRIWEGMKNEASAAAAKGGKGKGKGAGTAEEEEEEEAK